MGAHGGGEPGAPERAAAKRDGRPRHGHRRFAPSELRRNPETTLRGLDRPKEVLAPPQGGDIQPRVVVHGHAVLVVMPVLVPEQASPGLLRLIGTPTALITAEPQTLPALDGVVAELHHHEGAASLPGLLIDVVHAALKCGGPVYLSLRRSIDALADAIEERPLEVPADSLLTARRRVEALSMLWEDQSYCCLELQRRLSRISGFDATRERLRDLVSDADRGMKLFPRMEARLYELREHYESSLQQQTNRRLNLLAILSAIYMPATLIAGLYGVNFKRMPITDVENGYFIVMALMVVIVAAHFWYFSRRGWFK